MTISSSNISMSNIQSISIFQVLDAWILHTNVNSTEPVWQSLTAADLHARHKGIAQNAKGHSVMKEETRKREKKKTGIYHTAYHHSNIV